MGSNQQPLDSKSNALPSALPEYKFAFWEELLISVFFSFVIMQCIIVIDCFQHQSPFCVLVLYYFFYCDVFHI